MGVMAPGWLALALGIPLGVLVLGLPGLLVATALDPARPLLERLAVAPAVTVAVGFGAGSITSWIGLGAATAVVAAALVVAAVVSAVVIARRPGRAVPWRGRVRTLHLVLAGSVLLLLGTWVVSIASSRAGWALASPGIDANAHGIMTSRILQLGTLRPDVVTQFDLGAPAGESASFFYVLGLHAIAAVVASLVSVPSALVALTVVATIWLVLGVVVLARRVADERTAAWAAVVSAVAIPLLPFSVVFWGGLPLILGLALVPPAALVLIDARGGVGLVLPALAVAGLVAVHSPEVIAVGLLAVVTALRERSAVGQHLQRLAWMAVSGLLGLVLVAPTTLGLVTGGADRVPDPPLDGELAPSVVDALFTPLLGSTVPTGPASSVVVLSAAVALVLVVVGAYAVRRSSVGVAVTVTVSVFTVLGILAYAGLAAVAVRPWYSNGERLVTQVAALLPVLLAAGLGLAADRMSRRVGRRGPVVVGVLAAAVFVPLVVRGASIGVQGIDRFSVVTADDRAAFDWLSVHAAPGDRVLNDVNDGSTWGYDATRGTMVPVFGAMPSLGFAARPDFADRLYLRDHVSDLDEDSRAADLARQWRVRYVLSGEATLGGSTRHLDREAMASSPALREVFRSGDAVVYELVHG